MEFEDVLVEVGDYGKFQERLVLWFLVPGSALLPLFFMNVLFMVSVPDHWCKVPELETWNLTLEQEKLLRPPSDPKCSVYNVSYTELLSSPFWNWSVPENTSTIRCTNGWNYDKSDYHQTAATVWNMVCDESHLVSLVLTLASVGSIVGTPVYGIMSDKIGRKPTFYVAVIAACLTGIASILMPTFVSFSIMRMINGSIMPSIFTVPYIILLEVVGPTKRTWMNAISCIMWTVGMFALPLLAWLCRDYVLFGVITSSVTVIFFAYWKFLPESPRWLVSQEKYDKAVDIMMDISKTNGKEHTRDEMMKMLKKVGEQAKIEREISKPSPMDILRHRCLRKYFFVLTGCWVACGAAYYGLQINIPNLGGNEFLNFFYLAAVEIPGFIFAWFFMEKIGRRWCSVSTIILTGLALLVPVANPDYGTVSSLIGKFGSSAGFMAMYQQSAELFPTVVRSIGLGLCGTIHEVILIGIPYVVHLAEYGKFIPFLIIAIICIVAGTAASLLPETLNESLPQTIEDAEVFSKNTRFCTCTRRRRASCYEHRDSVAHAVAAAAALANREGSIKTNGTPVAMTPLEY